eukprot:scaffold1681_cov105-Isochrysis_galbana.AAC.11
MQAMWGQPGPTIQQRRGGGVFLLTRKPPGRRRCRPTCSARASWCAARWTIAFLLASAHWRIVVRLPSGCLVDRGRADPPVRSEELR